MTYWGKKKMKKNIFSPSFMHNCFPVLKQQRQHPTKAPEGFLKHQSLSQWGGVM